MARSVWYVDLGIPLNLTEDDLGHPDLPGLWDQLYGDQADKWQPGRLSCMDQHAGCPKWMFLQVRPSGARAAIHYVKGVSEPSVESDEHKALKDRVASAAESAGFTAEIEQRPGHGRRRTDVLVHGANGFLLGAEAQLSPITSDKIRRRSRIIQDDGITPLRATVNRDADANYQAPWALIDQLPWYLIAEGEEMPVRGGLRELEMKRCADRPEVCPDRGYGRCAGRHPVWSAVQMRFDDLIVRAAAQEWVPVVDLSAGSRRRRYFWTSATDHTTYIESVGGLPDLTTEARPEPVGSGPQPLTYRCLYGIDSGIRPAPVERVDNDAPIVAPAVAAIPKPRTPGDSIDRSPLLDWTTNGPNGAAGVGDPLPCRYCGRPALLREPGTRRGCHKVCAESELTSRVNVIVANQQTELRNNETRMVNH